MNAPLFVTWPFLNGRTCSEPLPSIRAARREAISVAIWSWDSPDDDEIDIVNENGESVIDRNLLIRSIRRARRRRGIVTTTFVINADTLVFW